MLAQGYVEHRPFTFHFSVMLISFELYYETLCFVLEEHIFSILSEED